MNSEFVLDNSLALAQRLIKETANEQERVVAAYQLTLGRRPTQAEVKESLDLVKEIRAKSETDAEDEVVWSGLCHALFASAEFRFVQ